MLDPMHALTHESLLLGEGLLLRGAAAQTLLNADDPEAQLIALSHDENHRIGATKDGCVLRCVPRVVDLTRGCRTPSAGELLTAGWAATLSGTLLEATADNLVLLLRPAEEPGTGLIWAGSMGSGLMLIELGYPVSTQGMTLRTSRSDPGEISFTLTLTHDAPGTEGLPLRLHRLKEATHD